MKTQKEYKTMKGFLEALANFKVGSPAKNIKGAGFERKELVCESELKALQYFGVNEYHCNTVYARRYGNYGATYPNTNDLYVISTELNNLLVLNRDNFQKLVKLFEAKNEIKNLGL